MTVRKSLPVTLLSVGETLAISLPTVLESSISGTSKENCDRRLESWSRKIVAHADIRLTVKGGENIDEKRTYLVMSNHQSHFDIPVIFHAFGSNLRMITKKELFRIPLFGPALREAGFIAIDRGDRSKALSALESAKDFLSGGTNIWIAPEGTRSRTGDLLPFKKGGFVLALETGLPILPLSIRGTRHVLPPSGVRAQRGVSVDVTSHPPIEVAAYRTDDVKTGRDRLMSDVRAAIESAV